MLVQGQSAGNNSQSCVNVLISQGLLDNQRAFTELDDMFRPAVLDFLRKGSRNHWLADDLANETFLRAYRSLSTFRGRSHQQFQSYLFAIAANLLRDHYRSQNHPQTTLGLPHPPSSAPESSDSYLAEKPIESRERTDMLKQALASLAPEQATLIKLSHLKGLKAEQIAPLLSKPSAQAVRAALCRAMKDLKVALKRQGYFDQVSA